MHKPVLLEETIRLLNIKSDGKYIDATVGFGGHSSEILKLLGKEGVLFAFDQDDEAIEYSRERLGKINNNYNIIKSNFKDMKQHIHQKVDGILFDLGVSSVQLDTDYRGFSYHKDAKLDMRMDTTKEFSAYNVVNEYPIEKLTNIFYVYGEEKYAKSIAKGIVNSRPINTTLELVDVIKSCVPEKYRRTSHPARKVFQAIRIEVNEELYILEQSLNDAFGLLNSKGRLAVITFHSLEDRIVKNLFNKLSKDDPRSVKLPVVPKEMKRKANLITKKPIVASKKELLENNRSRSAKLRCIEKI